MSWVLVFKRSGKFWNLSKNSMIKKTKSMRTAGYHVTDQNAVRNQTCSLIVIKRGMFVLWLQDS